MAINEHAHLTDAEEVRPGEWRHRHPHDHPTRPRAHEGLLESWFNPVDGHPHNHWPDDDREPHHLIDPAADDPARHDGDVAP